MTHLKTMLLAIRALPALAARLVVNLLPVLAVVGFAAALGACGGKMGDDDRAATLFVPLFVGAAIIGGSGGNSDNAPATMTENPTPPMTMTTTMPTMTMSVTMPEPMEPAPMPTEPQPVVFDFDAPEMGGLYLENIEIVGTEIVFRWHFIVLSVATGGENRRIFGIDIPIGRQMAISRRVEGAGLPDINRVSLHANGDIVPFVDNGATVMVDAGEISVAFQTRPTITALVQLCPIPWVVSFFESSIFRPDNPCPAMTGSSYSPDMRQVIYAAMADGFNRGVGIGESPFAFSGRYDGDNRAAGFTYDIGGSYALRTDYIRLPSQQDSEVWLDTYRFGALTRLNDETRFFAGIDNYQNAILVMDTNANNGENQHRLGFAIGKGYALKYEYRLNL